MISIIYPRDAIINYRSKGGNLSYLDIRRRNINNLEDHIATHKEATNPKKVKWVISFAHPFDYSKFNEIVEYVTKPRNPVDFSRKLQPKGIEREQIKRRDEYKSRMNIIEKSSIRNTLNLAARGMKESKQIKASTHKRSHLFEVLDDGDRISEISGTDLIEENLEIIRGKALQEERRKEAARMVELKKQEEEVEKDLDKALEDTASASELIYKVKFQNLLLQNLTTHKNEENKMIENGIQLFDLVDSFKTAAFEHVKKIVDELCLPRALKTMDPPVDIKFPTKVIRGSKNLPCEMIFKDKTFMVRVGIPSTADKFGLLDSEDDFPAVEEMQRREYNLELLALETILDIILDLGTELDSNIIVPLTCVVRYKGFNCLVQTSMDFMEEQVAFGKTGTRFKADNELSKGMSKIGKKLKIMPHTHKSQSQSGNLIEVSLSQEILVYRVPKMTLDSVFNSNRNRPKRLLDNKFLDTDRSMSARTRRDMMYYITRAMYIFPIDIDINKKTKHPTRHRLRPEFLSNYKHRLNPDTFKFKNLSKKTDKLESEMTDANKTLKNEMLKNLVTKMDRMEYLPLTSAGFTKIFHEFGVSMRYLGLATSLTRLPHIQEMCMVEMVSRSCKRLLKKKLTALTLEAGDAVADVGIGEEIDQKFYRTMKRTFEMEQKKLVAMFMNHIFGVSDTSKQFWSKVIRHQVHYDFHYKIEPSVDVQYLPTGALFNACVYHFDLKLKPKNYENIGRTEKPFTLDDILDFEKRIKSFSFKKHVLREASEKYSKFREAKDYTLALKNLRLKLTLEESLGRLDEFVEVLSEVADLHLEFGKYDEAISTCNKALGLLDILSPK